MKNNQKGFSAVEGLLAIIALALVIFVGFYVLNANKNTDTAVQSTPKSASSKKTTTPETTYKTPAGYTAYSNKEAGFSFAYPKEYGNLSDQASTNGVQIKKSSEPTVAYGPGISGVFSLFTHDSATAQINSRKYGPQIKLENNSWLVTETNPSDLAANTVGQIYKDLDGKPLTAQKNGKLAVYSLKSGDEGAEVYTFVFVSNGKLYELQTPTYQDGLYANFNQNATANDKTKFNDLVKNVRDSIRSL